MKVNVLILGTDINSYYMARCYNEISHHKVDLIGVEPFGFTSFSNICNVVYNKDLYNKKNFRKVLKEYAQNKKGVKTLLIATSDGYAKMVSENKEFLSKYYLFNYPKEELVNNFLTKDIFYTKYAKKDLDFPKTIIYDCKKEKIPAPSFSFPMIIKPGNTVNYNKNKFAGQKKIYKIESKDDYYSSIMLIKKSGYVDNLIIQEFIPGDDSNLFDSVFYCSSKGKAQIASFAQIALQEHTPSAIGNCTVLVNGYNQYGNTSEVVDRIKKFMESVGYCGFAEVDLKYDPRDKKFKILEINPRQGRSSYYLTPCGYNLVEYLIDDLFYNKEKKFHLIDEEYALCFVPKIIVNKYICNEELKNKVLSMYKEKKVCNPLKNKLDHNLKRRIYLILRDINYIKKYKNNHF